MTLLFWRTFMNIAISNIYLNGIIIGVSLFGIILCFVNMFHLLPEFKWLHGYFTGSNSTGIVPRILRPIALALHNKHMQITTSNLTELLDLVYVKLDNERDSVRYVKNTLIFLGLLGTFWGLIVTVGGFADLLVALDFNDASVLTNMQTGIAKPLSGMGTAFTSSLLGLAGSLVIGFLELQLQSAQNTILQELTDFMSKYIVQTDNSEEYIEMSSIAPVKEAIYSSISDIYDILKKSGYDVQDLIKIEGKYPAVVALGTNEKLIIGTTNVPDNVLQDTIKRIQLCFADTLEGISIDTSILCVTNANKPANIDGIMYFRTVESLQKYLSTHTNKRPQTKR
ncbi:MAG: hypothetical protein MJ156_03050, partial [Alphaproteobacteria bacterium]|nr:hypothetical protein [Alphaproteobacteria bacterium]